MSDIAQGKPEKITDATPEFRLVQLNGSFEAFGGAIDFLSGIEPFSRFDLGNFARAIRAQLLRENHVAAVAGNRIVGYVGWLPTRLSVAELWMKNEGPLTPARNGDADAVVLTVVAATDKRAITPLIRKARDLNPQRRVFFKRDYEGQQKNPKKQSVKNVTR